MPPTPSWTASVPDDVLSSCQRSPCNGGHGQRLAWLRGQEHQKVRGEFGSAKGVFEVFLDMFWQQWRYGWFLYVFVGFGYEFGIISYCIGFFGCRCFL